MSLPNPPSAAFSDPAPCAAGRIRLLVVDDHPVVRSGIVGMFSGEDDLCVVGEASDGEEAVALTRDLGPEVVLMDLRMPVLDGVEATRRIVALADRTEDAGTGTSRAGTRVPRVVILTTYDTDGDILRAVEAGAIGYLLKDSPREEILTAVRAAAVGRSALSPLVTTRLLGAARGGGAGPGTTRSSVTLSPREQEVLEAVARGLSNVAIGTELLITEATVKTHLLRINTKLGVESRTAAVTEALRRGLIHLS